VRPVIDAVIDGRLVSNYRHSVPNAKVRTGTRHERLSLRVSVKTGGNMDIATKAQHTPGPWQVKIDKDGFTVSHDVYSEDGYTIVHSPGRVDGTDEANARLIASAPELLSELRSQLGILGWFRNNCSDVRKRFDAERAITRTQTLIAKAEGR
jgi:hypothetical protein